MSFYVGLDLGQAQDYTALTVVEQIETRRYHLRHLERFELGTPYPDVVRRVAHLTEQPELGEAPALVVDATGVGRAVVDMFREAGLNPVAITIHGGDAVTQPNWNEYRVPKRELAGTLQALVQSQKLRFARTLPLLEVLLGELQSFRVKVNIATGHDAYEAWRERDHDDLVLALAIACWYAEQAPESFVVFAQPDGTTVIG